MSEPGQKSVDGGRRRSFLQLAGLGTLALGFELPDMGLDIALSNATKGMEFRIPVEFAEIPVPQENSNYRRPEYILLDAFDRYDAMRKHEHLPPAYLEKGPEYLSLPSLASRYPRLFEDEKYEGFEDWTYKLYGLIGARDLEEEVANANTPNIHRFSALSQHGIADHFVSNPGSEIINQAEDYILKKYGWDRKQLLSSIYDFDPTLPKITEEDWTMATQIITGRFTDAIDWIRTQRDEAGSPVSVSELVAYFLYQNNGDLKKSLWDSTLLLKDLARCDLDTLYADNTFDKAELIGELFLDEFSPQVSHNWLLDQFNSGKIPQDSQLYSAGGNDQDKNFMPINKAGTYYHCMNILTWAATCMDPLIVKSMVTAYYNDQRLGGIDHRPEHGIDKVNADLEVAQAAGRIKRMVDWQT